MRRFVLAAGVAGVVVVTAVLGSGFHIGGQPAAAKYTARVIGTATIGSITDDSDAGYINGSRFGSGQGGALVSMSAYVADVDKAPNNRFQMAIYSDAGGLPGSLVASTVSGTLTANTWNSLPIKASLPPSASFWLVYNASGSSHALNNMTYSNGGRGAWTGPVRFGTWPSTFGPAHTGAWNFAIYATYATAKPTPQTSPTSGPSSRPSSPPQAPRTTPTSTPTARSSSSPQASPSATPTARPTSQPTSTPTPRSTPTATPTAQPTPTPTPTQAPSPTPTAPPPPPPPPPVASGHVGGYWLYGANMPWLNWNSDFGGGGAGVAQNVGAVDAKLSAAHNAGMHYVRWWIFEGGSPQITRDGSGTPTGINPAVYTDIDAALAEAAKYGIFYDFVLFGSTSDDGVTHQWWEDPAKRAALARVLAPLFARYSGNSRIATWEIVNEPDWQTRNGITSVGGATATVDAIADAVHANSRAYVTVGEAQLQDMGTWVGHHIDYHSPHYYDNFGTGSNDPFTTRVSSPDGKPVVIGEFPADNGYSPSAQARYQATYQNGYAGAWAWSLSPEHTGDKIGVDLAGAAAFASGKTDLGPY